MGEYAVRKSDNVRIKIGTCESMYYLRYEDRHKVQRCHNSLDAAATDNLLWRIPFYDEDRVKPGEYQDYMRGLRLYGCKGFASGDFLGETLVDQPGIIQLRHECGILVNVPCHHGAKLPALGDAKVFWSGRSWFFELFHLKNTPQGVLPVIGCRHCEKMWRCDWADIWDYIQVDMRIRLDGYKREAEALAKKAEADHAA